MEFDDTILLFIYFFFLNWIFLRWIECLSKNLQFCSCVLYSCKQNVCTRNDIHHMWDPCQPLIHYSKTMKKVRINTSLIWVLFTKRSKFLVLLFETFIGNDPILLLFIYKIFHHSKSSQRMIRLSIDFWTKNFQINSHSVWNFQRGGIIRLIIDFWARNSHSIV